MISLAFIFIVSKKGDRSYWPPVCLFIKGVSLNVGTLLLEFWGCHIISTLPNLLFGKDFTEP